MSAESNACCASFAPFSTFKMLNRLTSALGRKSSKSSSDDFAVELSSRGQKAVAPALPYLEAYGKAKQDIWREDNPVCFL
jgi:hypothetical protein